MGDRMIPVSPETSLSLCAMVLNTVGVTVSFGRDYL